MRNLKRIYGRENANYIHANRYPVAAAQNLPQQKKGIGIRKNSLSLLSNRKETEGEDARAEGGWGSEIEEYEDSS